MEKESRLELVTRQGTRAFEAHTSGHEGPTAVASLSWLSGSRFILAVLLASVHPEMGYRSCLGILRLAKTYSDARLEAASQRALAAQACSYQSLRSILRRGLDRQPSPSTEQERSGPQHRNLRGSRYYVSPSKLVQ